MHAIIHSHNHKILNTATNTENEKCNCQKKETCPIPGNCCAEKIVYQATVKHDDGKTAVYIGCTESSFKMRYNNHKKSFRQEKYKNETTLSRYLWENNANTTPNIEWKILKKCKTFEKGQTKCDLCLSEKFFIIKNLKKPNLINKRTDIGNKCIHKRKTTFNTAVT